MHKKVRFKGEIYWRSNDGLADVLAPLDHFSDDGELLANPFRDVSYAVIEGDDIMRYNEPIGKVSELEDVE